MEVRQGVRGVGEVQGGQIHTRAGATLQRYLKGVFVSQARLGQDQEQEREREHVPAIFEGGRLGIGKSMALRHFCFSRMVILEERVLGTVG